MAVARGKSKVAPTVCAVVVSHDRRDLLRNCLLALRSQTRALDGVMVVDNASTDGTRAMLEEDFVDVCLVALSDNEGAAGGFHEGLTRAHEAGFEWLWLLHDDSVPTDSALEHLLESATAVETLPPPSLVTSKVLAPGGGLDAGSVPRPYYKHVEDAILASGHGLQPIRSARHVSLLVNRSVVERHGLPSKRYFGWSDDIEYTARILRRDIGYLAPKSVVHHASDGGVPFPGGNPGEFRMHLRNTLLMTRGPAWGAGEKLRLALIIVTTTGAFLRGNGFRPHAVGLVLAAFREGLA